MSHKFSKAVNLDVAENYDEAITNYEDAILENEKLHTDAFSNLAFIYWNLAFASPFEIKPEVADRWSIIGGERYSIILEMGINRQADILELIFWKRYCSHIVFGEDFTPKECMSLIESYRLSQSHVPYFFLWLFDKKKYVAECTELLRRCKKEMTTKNRYIISILSTRT